MLIQLSVVIVGLLSLVSILARGLDVIRWFGTAYICYLGFRRWQTANDWDPGASLQYRPAFLEGFTVALLNPTTLLFFVAFFPQFLDVGVNPGLQLLKLAATFWMLALVFDIGCAILASRIGASFRQRRHIVMRNKIAGGIMVAAALALSMARL